MSERREVPPRAPGEAADEPEATLARPYDTAARDEAGAPATREPAASALAGADEEEDEHPPRMGITRERALLFAFFVVCALAFLYFVLPQLGDVRETWGRLDEGDPIWLAVAVAMQILSMASYIAVFKGVHVPPGYPIGYAETYRITMASLAATRLFAAGGAGGVALTAWALRQSGMPRREVAERMIAFLVLTYAIYMVALVVCGLGLRYGVFHGSAPYALTMIPAYFGLFAMAVFLIIAAMPKGLEQRLAARPVSPTRLGRAWHIVLSAPARLGGGTRLAMRMVRHPDLALLGTIGWWGFSVGVLYASFQAFGHAPPIAVVVEGFFVGMLANLLPLPGGIGGVDAGMIGVFAGFGVDPGLALIAVLTYRLFAFWLPSVPGAIAYFTLRRTVARWREERALGRRPALGGRGTIQSEVSST